jgi:peptide/nickel transport system permease protein
MTGPARTIASDRGSSSARTLARFLHTVRRVLRVRLALPSAIWIGLVTLAAIAPALFATHDPLRQELMASLQGPSFDHWLGTDHLGRDVWSRIVYGSRVSLQVGLVAVGFAAAGGFVVGLIAGYYGGWVDAIIMRITDAVWSIPYLVLALALVAVRGASLLNVMIAIGVVYMPGFARLTRGQVLAVREREFVHGAVAIGARAWRIMAWHVTPNVLTPIIVFGSLSIGHAVIAEASLSFLGVGVPPPTPTWGGMLRDAYRLLDRAPMFAVSSGGVIFLTVLAANFLGDALRDVFDPKLRGVE